mgnify:CR=1 FL=1|tara:strand:+ start:508 stop:897 length:390 start_codon:yes stop_codon:yes gene_type:complete
MKKLEKNKLIGITALLVNAAKIDEHYTESEKKIIIKFIEKNNSEIEPNKLLEEAESLEKESNQLLGFTKLIKDETNNFKEDIIEQLWKIIISDKSIDQFESNFMRRICGLIYFDDKLSGEIKLRVKNKL